MSPASAGKRRGGLRAPHVVLLFLLPCCAAAGVYASVYSHADAAAAQAVTDFLKTLS